MRLDSIAKVIRSKNAGPCLLTLDLLLPDEAAYAELWGSTEADRPRGRAHLGTEDPDALNTLNTLNTRIGELISEGKYDYFDLYNDYDRFMINIGRKSKDTDTDAARFQMVNTSNAR